MPNFILTPSAATVTIVVEAENTKNISPAGLMMSVTMTGFDESSPASADEYDEQFHDFKYEWTHDVGYTATAPVNVFASRLSTSTASGPLASFTMRGAVTHTIGVTVTEPSSGKTATTSITRTLTDPLTSFTGANTLFISPGNLTTNMPAGATRYASLNTALTALADDESTDKLIIFNRAETSTFTGFNMNSNTLPTMHIIAGGDAGADPIVTCTGGLLWTDQDTAGDGSGKFLTIQNVTFNGPWNSAAETGASVNVVQMADNPPLLALYDGCSFDGFGISIYNTSGTNSAHRRTIVNDCVMDNYRDYQIQEGAGYALAVTNSRVMADINATSGGPKGVGSPGHNEHSPIRFNSGNMVIVSKSDFFSRFGWPVLGSYQSSQPCVRINADGDIGMRSNIQENTMEGGTSVLSNTPAADHAGVIGNCMVEKNYLIGNHQTKTMLGAGHGGTTFRNNICVWPSAQRLADGGEPLAVLQSKTPPLGVSAAGGAAKNQVVSNTVVNLMVDDDYIGDASSTMAMLNNDLGAAFTGNVESNNALWEPNFDTPNAPNGAFQATPTVWTVRNLEYFHLRTTAVTAIAGTERPTSTAAAFTPLTNTLANMSNPYAYDDFFGVVRPSSEVNAGAQEYTA